MREPGELPGRHPPGSREGALLQSIFRRHFIRPDRLKPSRLRVSPSHLLFPARRCFSPGSCTWTIGQSALRRFAGGANGAVALPAVQLTISVFLRSLRVKNEAAGGRRMSAQPKVHMFICTYIHMRLCPYRPQNACVPAVAGSGRTRSEPWIRATGFPPFCNLWHTEKMKKPVAAGPHRHGPRGGSPGRATEGLRPSVRQTGNSGADRPQGGGDPQSSFPVASKDAVAPFGQSSSWSP